MGRKARLGLFSASVPILAAIYLIGLAGLPRFGHYRGPYGDVVNAVTVPERHITDTIAAVNFDIRGFDTLGEEFIMFTSVIGVVLLLRRLRDETRREQKDEAPERSVPRTSDATRVFTVGIVGLLALFGIYMVTHGQLTPGGGFQGGVILGAAPLCVYLAGNFRNFRRVANHRLVEIAEAVGAAGYALVGLAGFCTGAAFLQNVIPLGTVGDVFSGGTVPLISLSVGLEVAAAFVLLPYQFLEEALADRLRSAP